MRCLRSFLIVFVVLASAAAAAAQDSVIYVVRHAERSDAPTQTMMGNDPPLSAAGQERAQRLAKLLRSAGIRHVFTTEFQRTRQTAAPLAAQENIKAVMAAAKDVDALVDALKALHAPALVVGHSNTVPEVLKKLGVLEAVTIADGDYDNLFIVLRHGTGKPTLITLHF
jgi:broad specificity phosphatase PhoE